MTKTPEIRIQFSSLLYGKVSQPLYDAGDFDEPLATQEECEKWTKAYRKAWHKKEKQILEGLCEITGLEFYQDVIDVNLAPMISGGMSSPIIISFTNEPDQFIDVLSHELIHVLFTDNQYLSRSEKDESKNLWWAKLFGVGKDFTEWVHIPLHAVLKALYLDILNEPYRLERDITDQYSESYRNAWAYVQEHDYREIINKIKTSYKNLK